MAVSCSFKAIVGSNCSHDRRDQSKSVNEEPLLSCVKDIESHKSLWSFTGVTGEQELILLRAAIFTRQQDVSNLTICPFHRSELGIGWRRSSNTCRVPNEIAHHSQGKGNTKSVKGDRGIGREISKLIFERTGIFVPVGSGMTNVHKPIPIMYRYRRFFHSVFHSST